MVLYLDDEYSDNHDFDDDTDEKQHRKDRYAFATAAPRDRLLFVLF